MTTSANRTWYVGLLVVVTLASGCRHREYLDDDDWTQSSCIPREWQEEPERVEPVRPSVIGWNAEAAGALARRMGQSAIVVVAYDGAELRILNHCQVTSRSRYRYRPLGETRVDEARLVSAEQVQERMPLATDVAAAPGQPHRLSRAPIGGWSASGPRVDTGALQGDCTLATHVVTGAVVGAYELVRLGDSEEVIDRRGVFRACTETTRPGPPEGCDTLLRLELAALSPRRQLSLAPPQTEPEPGPDPTSMSDDERMEYAKQLYVEGDTAFESGDYVTALIKFETAYNVYVPQLHLFNFNIAMAAFELGDCLKTKVALERFLDLVAEHPSRNEAAEALLELERSGCE
ncbi:MAG: outer membrane protein assembly factor BamD [Myxococcota bacterium]